MSTGSGAGSQSIGSEGTQSDCHAVLDSIPEPVVIATVGNGEIVAANEAATSLFERSKEELVGSHQASLHPETDDGQYRQLFAQHAATEGSRRILPNGSQIYVHTGGGEEIPVEINVQRDNRNGREVLIGVFRDISEREDKQATGDPAQQAGDSFFENSSMNIWKVALGRAKTHLEELATDVDSLETYLADHPEAVANTVEKIEVLDVNQNAVAYYDAASKAELGRNLDSVFIDHDTDPFSELLVAIATGETDRKIEAETRTLRGERQTDCVEVSFLESAGSQSELAYLVTHDITERKAREKEFRSFKQAVEHAGHGVLITDRTGTIEYVNRTFEDVTGYTKADVIGENPRLLQSGEHDETFYEHMWETILGGEVWSAELVNERKDGETYVIDQTIAPIFDEDGEIQRFVAVNQDITDRKERERELRNLQQAVKHAGYSMYITDEDGRIEYVNDAFEALTGYSATDVTGNTHQIFRPPDQEAERTDRTVPSLDGEEWTGETVVQAKSGRRIIVEETIAPIEDEAGVSQGFVGIQTDITERKLREQQLSVFSRVLRHNLRNDGTAIMGRAQLLEESVTDPEKRDHLRTIQENIGSLLEIGEKAHHVQRTIAESLTVEERRDLLEVLENTATAVDFSDSEVTVTVESTFEEHPQVDPRVVPAIQELVQNAVEHNDGTDPEVTIRAGPHNGMAAVEIADNGPGIPPTERRVIVEGTEEPLTHGSGLGLWLADWLTTFVGGEVQIDTGPDGTTVTVTVPRNDA